MSIGLPHYIILSAALFIVGVFGALTRKNAIRILMCIELMINAANINMVAVTRYLPEAGLSGQIFTLFIIAVTAAESILGLAIILVLYKRRITVNADEMNLMKY